MLLSSLMQYLHTHLSWKVIVSFSEPQNTQEVPYFLSTTVSPSTKNCKLSKCSTPRVFLTAFGITILPRPSIFLIKPVDFIRLLSFLSQCVFKNACLLGEKIRIISVLAEVRRKLYHKLIYKSMEII